MKSRSGQNMVEFAVLYTGVLIPFTFGMIFLCQILWVWHSVVELTRDVARYASTHCYTGDNTNVINYMQQHVPPMVDASQFREGQATLNVQYQIKDSNGVLGDFSCDGSCSVDCEPDAVTVSISGYQFNHFFNFMKLPALTIPPFQTSVPVESLGCDPQTGDCSSLP